MLFRSGRYDLKNALTMAFTRSERHLPCILQSSSESAITQFLTVHHQLETLGQIRIAAVLWRFASIKELVYVIEGCIASILLNIFFYFFTYKPIFRSYFLLYGASLFLLTCVSRFSYRLVRLLYRSNIHGRHVRNTMIIGAYRRYLY